MGKITDRDALIAYCDQHPNLVKDANPRSTRYETYINAGQFRRWYIGGKGELLTGRTLGESVPMQEVHRKAMIKEGRRLLEAKLLQD